MLTTIVLFMGGMALWTLLLSILSLWLEGTLQRLARKRERLPAELDPEVAARAAVDLYAIRRRLDVAWLQSEQRRESTRICREIEEALSERRP
jgi:hypothetical protein